MKKTVVGILALLLFCGRAESITRVSYPLEHGRVTSSFGSREDPFDGSMREHHGVDIAAPRGSTIVAIAPGRVIYAGPYSNYGNLVAVLHGSHLVSIYAHCDEIEVDVGDFVDHGAFIASVGSTGRSTGPHLHFELRFGGRPVDPAILFAW